MTLVAEAVDVNAQIVECVDAGLKQLGQSLSQIVYFYLKKNFGIKKEEIPNNPEAFSQMLQSIFGAGANLIEEQIVHKIQEKFKLCLNSNTGLVEAIQTAKKRKGVR